ncbi:MAG: hypothetical protein V1913_17050 [Fibrobacterota bacterium]
MTSGNTSKTAGGIEENTGWRYTASDSTLPLALPLEERSVDTLVYNRENSALALIVKSYQDSGKVSAKVDESSNHPDKHPLFRIELE